MAGISDCYDDDDFDYAIPVFIHGVKHNFGGAVVTEELASEIVLGLNEMFNNSSSGSNQRIFFDLAKYDENDQCFPGFKNHNTNISNPVVQASHDSNIENIFGTEDERNRIFENYLNIFIVERLIKTAAVQVNIDGYGVLPPSINDSDFTYPAVFFTESGYQEKGSALVAHEIGHFFGLYHVFEGNCDASLCTAGDFIESTVPCQQVIGGCNSITNSCDPEVPYPSENLMSYTSCRNQFNSEQFDRIR